MKIVVVVMVILTCHSIMGTTLGASNQAVGALANRAVQTMKKVDWNSVNNQAQNGKLFYEKLKKGYVWYKRLRDETLKKQEALNTGKSTADSLQAIKEEILTCTPVDKKKICFSPCQKSGYKYEWCYDSSEQRPSQWSLCSCNVKKPILEYLDLTKKQLLEPVIKPWTDLELVLLVITSLLGTIGLFTGPTVAVIYWRNRNEVPVFGNQQGFIPNPIYAGAGNQE
jgi:flavin-binding protein dodecin